VSFQRDFDASEPTRPEPVTRLAGARADSLVARTGHLAGGTLACPRCDAPVALARPLTPAAPLACPYCGHAGALRDFLSLTAPTRPARVVVRVVPGGRAVRSG
jgi:hypothetical protein